MVCFFASAAFSMSNSGVYPHFSSSELATLKAKDSRAHARVLDYQRELKKFAKLSQNEQLARVNLYLNGLLSQHDAITNATPEMWATPKEFLYVGYGDCEDYALIKYYSLIRLGFEENKLFLLIVKEKFRGGDHMVLAYFDTTNAAPLILDNLSFRILHLDKRVDLEAQFFINASGVYTSNTAFELKKVAQKHPAFSEIQRRVSQNR